MILNAKYFNVKNLWNCIFRASRRASFSYFRKVALDNVCVFGRGEPLILFRVFMDHVTMLQHLRWSYWLETVVNSYYIELCVKYDRAPRSDSEMHRSV